MHGAAAALHQTNWGESVGVALLRDRTSILLLTCFSITKSGVSWCIMVFYLQVWETKGEEGIEQLRGSLTLSDPDGGFKRLMSHSRGAPELGRELGVNLGDRVSADEAPRVSEAGAGAAVTACVCVVFVDALLGLPVFRRCQHRRSIP